MTVLKNIESRGLCWDLRGKLGGGGGPVSSVPNGNHIGGIDPKKPDHAQDVFFGSMNCSMCFPLLTPKVRGGRGGGFRKKPPVVFLQVYSMEFLNSNSH